MEANSFHSLCEWKSLKVVDRGPVFLSVPVVMITFALMITHFWLLWSGTREREREREHSSSPLFNKQSLIELTPPPQPISTYSRCYKTNFVGENLENLDFPLRWNNNIGIFKSNKQFYSIMLFQKQHSFVILCRFRYKNKLFLDILIFGNSRFPTKQFYSIDCWILKLERKVDEEAHKICPKSSF